MNFPYIKIILVLLAILFVPLIPSEGKYTCTSDGICEDSAGYVSIYKNYFGTK